VPNQVIRTVEGDVKQVVSRVVRDADHRDPFGDDVVAKIHRSHFDLG
jgi:hypothetical protein